MGAKEDRAELLAELRDLRNEVRQLREAQAAHTCIHWPPPVWYPSPYVLPPPAPTLVPWQRTPTITCTTAGTSPDLTMSRTATTTYVTS